MECFPIIYSRTKLCDYYDDFHVSPSFIDKSELLKCIRIASNESKGAKNDFNSFIVFSMKNYFVLGNYFFAYSLCDTDNSLENYCEDEVNRRIGLFCGFAAYKDEEGKLPIVSFKEYSKAYKKYIVPVWEEKNIPLVSQIPEVVNLEEEIYIPCNIKYDYAYKNCMLFGERNADETELISKNILHMAIHSDERIAFCSKISRISEIDKKVLTHVITTSTLITNIKYLERQIAIQQYNEAQRKKSIFQKLAERIKKIFGRSNYNEVKK